MDDAKCERQGVRRGWAAIAKKTPAKEEKTQNNSDHGVRKSLIWNAFEWVKWWNGQEWWAFWYRSLTHRTVENMFGLCSHFFFFCFYEIDKFVRAQINERMNEEMDGWMRTHLTGKEMKQIMNQTKPNISGPHQTEHSHIDPFETPPPCEQKCHSQNEQYTIEKLNCNGKEMRPFLQLSLLTHSHSLGWNWKLVSF